MYLSRVELEYQRMPLQMLVKLEESGLYAQHQWLWQLFAEQEQRDFLFRQEEIAGGLRFFLLSKSEPLLSHNLLQVQSKPFSPQLRFGQSLQFSLRVNPVVTKNKKRSDVLMNAKYQAPKGMESAAIWALQEQAVKDWLSKRAENCGFTFDSEQILVNGYQQHRLFKPKSKNPIHFSTVDLDGCLTVTDPDKFLVALKSGFGKSRGMGCGLMLIKRG